MTKKGKLIIETISQKLHNNNNIHNRTDTDIPFKQLNTKQEMTFNPNIQYNKPNF